MREEDLLRDARKLLTWLNDDKSIVGTATEFISENKSYYLQCTTLIEKKTKNIKRIINLITEETGREPLEGSKDGFKYLSWQYFLN